MPIPDPDFHVRQILYIRRTMERADRRKRRNGFLFLGTLVAIGILSLLFPSLHLWIGEAVALVIIYLHLQYKLHLPVSKAWSIWFGHTAVVVPPLKPSPDLQLTNRIVFQWVKENIKGDCVIRHNVSGDRPDFYKFWRRDDFERFAARWMDYQGDSSS